MTPRSDSRQRGLTLLELMVSLAMMSVLIISVVNYVGSTRTGLLKQEVSAVLLDRSSRIGSNLRAGTGGARLLMADYGGTPDFSSYRDWVRAAIAAQATTAQPAPFTLPPVVTNARSAPLNSSSTASQALWGNELLFVAALKPVSLTVRYGPNLTAVAEVVSVDRIQFVYIYPTLVRVGAGGLGNGLRLAEWRSQPFALYGSLSEATGLRLTETCKALIAMGYTWAFDLDAATTPASAWYEIQNTGVLNPSLSGPGLPAQAHWAFLDDYDMVADFLPRPGQDRGQVGPAAGSTTQSGPARFVLAFNNVNPGINPQFKTQELRAPGKNLTVPAHAQPERSGQAGFPGGFEVGIFGRPQAREVVLRHVLMAVAATDPGRPTQGRMAYEGLNFLAVKNDY